MKPASRKISVDCCRYDLQIYQTVSQPAHCPKLVIVAYQPNKMAQEVLRVCIQGIQWNTPEKHELWVVDNNSPGENAEWLLKRRGINVVLNRTEPIPPEQRSFRLCRKTRLGQENWGSYANAVALELAVRLIDSHSRYFMALHMDTLPCRKGWLSFLLSKLEKGVGAAGVRLDRVRTEEGVLHVLGYLVDFQLFRQLRLNFFPQLPKYDVGDLVTIGLRDAGYGVFACPNTLWEPKLAKTIPSSSPLRELHVDRSFDDEGNVIFLHLGRGVGKCSARHRNGTTPQEWVQFAERQLLSSSQENS
jgi:hypothetical protein